MVTASEGGPRARVYGQLRPLGGQTVWAGAPREVREEQDAGGKGGGASTEVSKIYRSYAIGFCEGPITRYSRIWKNNELVYDARPAPDIPWEDSEDFLKKITLYLGDEAQMPSPVIEAELGAGNVPPMRGTAYLVADDEELTSTAGAIPAYQAEVFRGTQLSFTTPPYDYLMDDRLELAADELGASRRDIVKEGDAGTDAFGLAISPLDAVLHSAVYEHSLMPDSLALAAQPMDSTLRQSLQEGSAGTDSLALSITPADGELRVTLRPHVLGPDGLDITITPIDGGLE